MKMLKRHTAGSADRTRMPTTDVSWPAVHPRVLGVCNLPERREARIERHAGSRNTPVHMTRREKREGDAQTPPGSCASSREVVRPPSRPLDVRSDPSRLLTRPRRMNPVNHCIIHLANPATTHPRTDLLARQPSNGRPVLSSRLWSTNSAATPAPAAIALFDALQPGATLVTCP